MGKRRTRRRIARSAQRFETLVAEFSRVRVGMYFRWLPDPGHWTAGFEIHHAMPGRDKRIEVQGESQDVVFRGMLDQLDNYLDMVKNVKDRRSEHERRGKVQRKALAHLLEKIRQSGEVRRERRSQRRDAALDHDTRDPGDRQ
jgi:hypothetical protein